MIHHHGGLDNLRNQFIKQVEILCGNPLHVVRLTSRWGVYKYPGRKHIICNIIERTQKDKDFPHCPLPHLKIATSNALTTKAGVKPDLLISGRYHGQDAAYWCISTPHNAQFTRVANDISKIYPYA